MEMLPVEDIEAYVKGIEQEKAEEVCECPFSLAHSLRRFTHVILGREEEGWTNTWYWKCCNPDKRSRWCLLDLVELEQILCTIAMSDERLLPLSLSLLLAHFELAVKDHLEGSQD
jgi:hypothetical protein